MARKLHFCRLLGPEALITFFVLQCSPQDTVLDVLERVSPNFEAELRHVSH